MTAADVIRVYRTLLGRSPSGQEAADQLAASTDWRVLLDVVASSDEYRVSHLASVPRQGEADSPLVNIWHPELQRFAHPPGAWSQDGQAIVGKDGWVFLVRGSNSVADQYQLDYKLPHEWSDRWAEIVQVRRSDARELGILLALLIVPDKLSVLSSQLPDQIALNTRPPAAVLAGDRSLGVTYPVERLAAVTEGAYLRTDTHLSLAGNRALASAVFDELAIPSNIITSIGLETEQYVSSGDLGQRFAPHIVEIVATHGSMGGAKIIDDNLAEMRTAGQHIGTRRVLRNESAADRRTVVVFGDSYCLPAGHYQSPAWFLAQYFREVHFVWSPFGWDKAYVKAVGAEVVLCEMAERFVPRAPAPRIDVSSLAKFAAIQP
jgi:alginate O-acetyltransferase complex protein AlgJ